MTFLLIRLLIVIIAAYMWAHLEVQIEGKDGWAKNLPTWRMERNAFLDLFLGGRPLTGFHFWAFGFVFFMFHVPAIWAWNWTWPIEVQILGSILLFWVLEDFIWFIVNPHYGWSRYNAKYVTWHPHWFLGLPADHWGMIIVSLSCLIWSHAAK